MNLNGSVVLDIDSLVQLSLDKSSGGSSPKTTKALSRKNCGRMERRSCEDVEIDDPSRKNIVKDRSIETAFCNQQNSYGLSKMCAASL
ncbi:hypothetical protein ZOSMA_22G01340 [Zostera marina]|uniref:Uncharacterized protein n=1 Tax=Zostera marina TaxID=29655 RepID=A0A0K9PIP6_ZOSMR|nr:hypothetical protein ZOSMA_22G01340 [Zostera marina]